MQTVSSIQSLRAQVANWRSQQLSVAFVPTMGNLHEGHLQLVRTAQNVADKVVVSIFVNPAQFGPNEDFERYPRTEAQDQALLTEVNADLLFLPGVAEIYPASSLTCISLPKLANLHCGLQRPGHFDGVALVVCKLLNMVQPDVLLLGEKDFQQLAVIRQMVADLNMPLQVLGVPTVRASDGLALSSRNGYLTDEQRAVAPLIYQTLQTIKAAVLAGERGYLGICTQHRQSLNNAGFDVDYLSLCRSADLQFADKHDTDLVILAAARLGSTRLIDNLAFSLC